MTTGSWFVGSAEIKSTAARVKQMRASLATTQLTGRCIFHEFRRRSKATFFPFTPAAATAQLLSTSD